MRRKLIAGNWKMYKTAAEAVALVEEIKKGAAGAPGDTLVAPPFTALGAAVAAAKGSPIAVAAQNMHFEKEGAFTGEVSPAMLVDAGVSHVILGHSERRQYFAETDEGVAKKTKVALDNGLTPISCVGELLAEREADRTAEVLVRQVSAAYAGLPAETAKATVVAYEPVWAIGTGKVATPEQARDAHRVIRATLDRVVGPGTGGAVAILYGGSVNAANAATLFAEEDLDGALVGGASLEAAGFWKIVAAASARP